jgi:copper resistance protein C
VRRPGLRVLASLAASGALVLLGAAQLAAHAFPERFEPRVGATVRTAPSQVRIWFDGDIEPRFSQVRVASANGQPVDRGDSQVDSQNRRLLHVGLAPLAPGKYRVTWSVLSVDGHRTEGDYSFTLKAPD